MVTLHNLVISIITLNQVEASLPLPSQNTLSEVRLDNGHNVMTTITSPSQNGPTNAFRESRIQERRRDAAT